MQTCLDFLNVSGVRKCALASLEKTPAIQPKAPWLLLEGTERLGRWEAGQRETSSPRR